MYFAWIKREKITTPINMRTKTRLDGQHSDFFFLSGLQKLQQRAKKFIEFHGEYVE